MAQVCTVFCSSDWRRKLKSFLGGNVSTHKKAPQQRGSLHLWFGKADYLYNKYIRAEVQVCTFAQGNPADGLGLDLGYLCPEVGFYGRH